MKELDLLLLRYLRERLRPRGKRRTRGLRRVSRIARPGHGALSACGRCPRPIPATRHCAARPAARIDLDSVASRARCGVAGWLALAASTSCSRVALPWLARLAICLCHRRCRAWPPSGTFVLLRGPRAVRAIEWTAAGEFARPARAAARRRVRRRLRCGVVPAGIGFCVLWLRTPATALHGADCGDVRTPRAFRRLVRCLTGRSRRLPGAACAAADTIRPKV